MKQNKQDIVIFNGSFSFNIQMYSVLCVLACLGKRTERKEEEREDPSYTVTAAFSKLHHRTYSAKLVNLSNENI